MALSSTIYTIDAGQVGDTEFDLIFEGNTANPPGYIKKAHVFMWLNDVQVTEGGGENDYGASGITFTWVTDSRVSISGYSAILNDKVEFRRTIPMDKPVINFVDRAGITEAQLDTQSLANLYAVHEIKDGFGTGTINYYTLAKAYATYAEDVNVETGTYSALHWSAKAQAYAAAALASQTAAGLSEIAAALSETNAAASEAAADADATATAADAVSTAADAAATAADVISTNADVVTTNADVVLADASAAAALVSEGNAADSETAAAASAAAALVSEGNASDSEDAAAASAAAAASDAADTAADAIATAADRVQTGLDAVATAADRVQTGLDAAATAADVVSTNADAASTAADAISTAADAAATAQDAIDTAADLAATAQDVIDAAASASAASDSEDAALVSELKAADWASEDEDVEVEPGLYSALHWAAKAYESALSAGGMPSGTIQIFGNATPPTGWTRKTDWADNSMFIFHSTIDPASGAGGSVDAKAAHTHTGPSHTHTGPSHRHLGGNHRHVGGAHTHTAGTIYTPSHIHQWYNYSGVTDDNSFNNVGAALGIGTTSRGNDHIETNASSSSSLAQSYWTGGQGNITNGGSTGSGGGVWGGYTQAYTGYDGTGATGAAGTGATGDNSAPLYQIVIAAEKD